MFFHLDLEGDPTSPASFREWLSRVNASNHGVDENQHVPGIVPSTLRDKLIEFFSQICSY